MGYTSRGTELLTRLEEFSDDAEEQILEALRNCLTEYSDEREETLESIEELIEHADVSTTDTQDKWKRATDEARDKLNRLFGDAVEDLMLPPSIQLFWATTVDQENKFFESLGDTQTSQLLDDLIAHQKGLSDKIAELRDRWKFILQEDKGFETEEQKAVQELDALLQKILADASAITQKLRETLNRVIAEAGAVAEKAKKFRLDAAAAAILDALGVPLLGPIVKMAAELLATSKDDVRRMADYLEAKHKLVERYHDLIVDERTVVLGLFQETRDELETYLESSDVSKAVNLAIGAKEQLVKWASGLSDGQQRDAQALATNVAGVVDRVWSVTKEIDEDFRTEFNGIFLAPLGSKTVEQLAKTEQFAALLTSAKSGDVPEELEEEAEAIRDLDEDLDEAIEELEDAVSDLPTEARAHVPQEYDELIDLVRDDLRDRLEELVKAYQGLGEGLEPSKLLLEFSRKELEEALD